MRQAVLCVNLGTPDSPDSSDVKRYLKEFLLDPYVIDIPWLWRQCLVRGAIIPGRYQESAKSYERIWEGEGSPLLVHTQAFVKGLKSQLDPSIPIEFAMRYQNPSIKSVLQKLEPLKIDRLILFPLFPQFAKATTGSIINKVSTLLNQWKTPAKLSVIEEFASNSALVETFCHNAPNMDQYDHVIFSFHGLPLRQLMKSDRLKRCLASPSCCENRPLKDNCYRAHCFATARAIAHRLELTPEQMTITFQSRLGKEEWLKPYTSEVIQKLALEGNKKVLIFSPSFTTDCLETLFEIGIEGKALFLEKGGEVLDLVPSLNDHPIWIEGAQKLIEAKLKEPLMSLQSASHFYYAHEGGN